MRLWQVAGQEAELAIVRHGRKRPPEALPERLDRVHVTRRGDAQRRHARWTMISSRGRLRSTYLSALTVAVASIDVCPRHEAARPA